MRKSGRGRGGGGGCSRTEEDGGVHSAARRGDLQSLEDICDSNPLTINSRDKHSRTPLHLAAWSGQTQVVTYLCKHKADVGATAMDDMGAIHFAAQKGHLDVVRTLLSSGVSVKVSNRKGLTALHYAAQGSNLELVKYLVRKGASLTSETKAGKTPLDLAKNEEIMMFLKECQDSLKQGETLTVNVETEECNPGETLTANVETEECNPKPLFEDKAAGCDDEAGNKHEEEDSKDEKVKRKEEATETNENLSEPKKPRIALNHLLAADDTIEED